MTKYCHEMIAKVAKEIAGEVYEIWASKYGDWYKENRSQKDYIDANWPTYIESARSALADVLRVGKLPDEVKETIADALIKDNSIRGRRKHQVHLT